MDANQIVWVYITTGDVAEAQAIGRALVEARLAACVNIFPQMESLYRWEGRLQQDREAVLIAKTVTDRFDSLKNKVLELHSYECPCIIALPVAQGHTAYINWISGQVA